MTTDKILDNIFKVKVLLNQIADEILKPVACEMLIEEIVLHAGANGCGDAEIRAVLKNGSVRVFHLHRPTEKTIAILRDSIGEHFSIEGDA